MKVDILDAHDRLEHFTNQSFDIGQCCQSIIDRKPFGEHSFYIFAHSRTFGLDEKIAMFNADRQNMLLNPLYKKKYVIMADVPEKKIIWQPRLTKPKAQTNSMLFKVKPGSDNVCVIWMIPDRSMWGEYKKGNLAENRTVCESIYEFENNRARMEAKEGDDLNDAAIDAIYRNMSSKIKPVNVVAS